TEPALPGRHAPRLRSTLDTHVRSLGSSCRRRETRGGTRSKYASAGNARLPPRCSGSATIHFMVRTSDFSILQVILRAADRYDVLATPRDLSRGVCLPVSFGQLAARAAFTRSARKGTVRRRTPVASNTALPNAAATGVDAASPVPSGGWSKRWISSNSSAG